MITNKPSYAGFSKRLKAFLYDYLLILGYIVTLSLASIGIFRLTNYLGVPLHWPQNLRLQDATAFLILILPVILYFTWHESSPKQATWGKRKVGLIVVDKVGNRLTKSRTFLRSLLKLLPWQLAHTSIFQINSLSSTSTELSPIVIIGFSLAYGLIFFYIFSIILSRDHRSPYDWVTGSYVAEGEQRDL